MEKKLRALIERFENRANELYPSKAQSSYDYPDYYNEGMSDGISEVLDELHKLISE